MEYARKMTLVPHGATVGKGDDTMAIIANILKDIRSVLEKKTSKKEREMDDSIREIL